MRSAPNRHRSAGFFSQPEAVALRSPGAGDLAIPKAPPRHRRRCQEARLSSSIHLRMYAGQLRSTVRPPASRLLRKRTASRSARSRSVRSSTTTSTTDKRSSDRRSSLMFSASSRPLTVNAVIVPSVVRSILSIGPRCANATIGPIERAKRAYVSKRAACARSHECGNLDTANVTSFSALLHGSAPC